MSFSTTQPANLRPRREKMFGAGRPRPLDRNAKARITHYARCLSRRTEKVAAPSISDPQTPLEEALNRLGRAIGVVV
jgi:hypothetical protein